MRDPRIPMKSPWVAGILAFLLPGAGHWYQGRRFKATVFSVCILSVFVWGMVLGNLQPVYSQVAVAAPGHTVQMERGRPTARYTFGYGAQILVGGPALPALIQQERFRSDEGLVRRLDSLIDSDFVGVLHSPGDGMNSSAAISGRIQLKPVNPEGGEIVEGSFLGQFEDGRKVEFELGRTEIDLGRRIFGSPRRYLECSVVEDGVRVGRLEGSIRRSFVNWFQAPRDNLELDRLHGELSRRFDLASVFTWIAGLLNLLAIWDAVDGPAYGYGDEEQPDEDEDDDGKSRGADGDDAAAE